MLGLSSEVSLPPVSKLCEEFDCVPAAGAAACPANENALSLLSSSAIDCEVRSYPLAGSVGDLRLITCESDVPLYVSLYLVLRDQFRVCQWSTGGELRHCSFSAWTMQYGVLEPKWTNGIMAPWHMEVNDYLHGEV